MKGRIGILKSSQAGSRQCSCPPGISLPIAITFNIYLAAIVAGCNPADSRSEWMQLEDFAGGQVRAVWLTDVGDGMDIFAEGGNLLLMGIDSRLGKSERRILPEPGGYFKPLITPGGDRIVFTNTEHKTACVVDFDGQNLRYLLPGIALAVWPDPADGKDRLFLRLPGNDGYGKVVKVLLDNPARCSVVWDMTGVEADNFQVSADGKWAGGLFPWPNCGVIACGSRHISKIATGCWTSFSPDNSRILWCLDGEHRAITLYDCKPEPTWLGGRKIRLDGAQGIEGGSIYHPRWTNNPRFMAITGPYDPVGDDIKRKTGSRAVEIYIGRFDPGLTTVEKWFRLTENKQADFYPDVWIGEKNNLTASRPAASQPAPADDAGTDEIVVEAELLYRPQIPEPNRYTMQNYKQALVGELWLVRKVISGSLSDDLIIVAQWAIRDMKKIPLQFDSGKICELKLSKYEKVPQLEGEKFFAERWHSGGRTCLRRFYLKPQ